MKTILVEIDVEGAPQAIKNINDLENAISSLEDELKQAEFGSEQFKKLSRELTKAQKELKNTELSLEALDSEQVASEFGALTGSVGDLTGAFVLLGGEDGTIAETAEKIQTAIGVSMAFKGAIEGISAGRKLLNNALATSNTLQKINNLTNVAATTIMGLFSTSVTTTTFAFKALKGAIIATGIGALVIGITMAISAIADFVSGSDDAEKKQKELDRQLEQTNSKIELQTKAYEKLNKEIDINLKKKIGQAKLEDATSLDIIKLELEAEEEKLKLADKAWRQSRDDFNEGRKRHGAIVKEIGVLVRAMRKAQDKKDEAEDALFFKQQEYALALKKEEEDKLKRAEESFKKLIELGLKLNEKDLEALHKLRLARKEADAETLEDFIAIEKMKRNHLLKNEELTKNERRLIRFESEQEILKITKEFAEKEAELKEEELQKEREHQQNLADIRNEFLNELEAETELFTENFLISEQEKEIRAVEDKYNRLKELATQYGEDLTHIKANEEKAISDIEKKFAKERLQAQQQAEMAKVQMASDALGAISQFITAFAKEDEESQRKAFNLNKAVSIAQALVNTSLAVTAALTAGGNPIKLATGAQFVEAGIAAVMGAAQVATIAKTQFQGSQGATPPMPSTGTGGGTGATTQPPAFNVVGQSGFNQIATALGQGQPPIQAFVVSQDVTTAQQLDNAIIQTATF